MTDHTHELRSLRPTHPLGWLAAVGLHRVVSELDQGSRLSWADEGTPYARLWSSLSYEELLDAVADLWETQAEGQTVVSVEVDGEEVAFPPDKPLAAAQREGAGGLNDAAKMLPEEYRSYAEALGPSSSNATAWLRAVATDMVLDDSPDLPVAALNSLYLLSRQQRLYQQFEAVWEQAREYGARELLAEALTAWRRRPSKGGMNWDIDANVNAAEAPDGRSRTSIVPGATWLAMMALPALPVTASRGRLRTRGVVEYREDGRRRLLLLMPCWASALDAPAVEALLEHPKLDLDRQGQLIISSGELNRLGVLGVHGAPIVGRSVGSYTEHYLGTARPILSGG